MDEYYTTRCRAFETSTIEEMEDELNNFFMGKWVISSPIYYINGKWVTMIYYKIKESNIIPEPKREKAQLEELPNEFKATEKQIALLKKLGFKGDLNITKQQAYLKIKDLMKKEEKDE